ncbi:hypothetical protein C1645_874271 [Glomus cerebriforme]|uniref:Uncharacterized protein n=1 Tax=Glomus cerebriforme TaxID=658196 RepID=A0A397TE26_9GLOM|nr:hypothetical protein C1645_874271 [Glomus cerebriforme]
MNILRNVNGVVVVVELSNPEHKVAHTKFSFQFESAFANLQPLDQVDNIADINSPSGNPWPTIVCEIANTQSLPSITRKVNNFWLLPNQVEDVIVIKLWPWTNCRQDANGLPLRRLTCYKFCRRRSRHTRSGYHPLQTIEFGTITTRQRRYNGCSARGICTLSIEPACIYAGCPGTPPYPLPGNVVIDLYIIQQAIFRRM